MLQGPLGPAHGLVLTANQEHGVQQRVAGERFCDHYEKESKEIKIKYSLVYPITLAIYIICGMLFLWMGEGESDKNRTDN